MFHTFLTFYVVEWCTIMLQSYNYKKYSEMKEHFSIIIILTVRVTVIRIGDVYWGRTTYLETPR